jgi:hypothetical protein
MELAKRPKVPPVVGSSTKRDKMLKKQLKALSINKVDKTSIHYKNKIADSEGSSSDEEAK